VTRRRRGGAATPTTKPMEQMLWDAACSIRGEKDAGEFKDYLLPLLFLKRLSDVFDATLWRNGKRAPPVVAHRHTIQPSHAEPSSHFAAQIYARLTNPAKQNIITSIRGSRRPVADLKSEPRPASNRNQWPASYWNAWPASSVSAPPEVIAISTRVAGAGWPIRERDRVAVINGADPGSGQIMPTASGMRRNQILGARAYPSPNRRVAALAPLEQPPRKCHRPFWRVADKCACN